MAYADLTVHVPTVSSSYPVKFRKEEFLRLIKKVRTIAIYNVKNMYFFP